MHARRSLEIVTAVLAIGALGPSTVRAHDPITTRVTWTREISRIVEARCVTCHSPGGRAPMSLHSYEEARPWAKAIKEEVLTRRMPKWHAARGYGDFSNDPSLSMFEIALIAAWADGGAPKGTDEDKRQGTREKRQETREKGQGTRDEGEGSKGTHLTVTIPCGDAALAGGSLIAVRPQLAAGASVGIAVRLPDGRREIVAVVRDYDPDFPTTYWLRVPIVLSPGSRLIAVPVPQRTDLQASVVADESCATEVTMESPR